MKVCEKVQKKGVTTYNEVADELVAEFSSADNHMSPIDSVKAEAEQTHKKNSFTFTIVNSFFFFFPSMYTTKRIFGGVFMMH